MPAAPYWTAEERIAVDATTSPAYVQAVVRAFVRGRGGTTRDEWCVAIAASEAATNIAKFAPRGLLVVRVSDESPATLELIAEDEGPGVANVDRALEDGFSDGAQVSELARRRGLGIGLGAIARLMDELSIGSRAEGGARLVARRRLGRR